MRDSYEFWYPIVCATCRTIFRLCGGFHVEGAEHVPRSGGVLLAANHVSYADPPALGSASPRPPWFMAKEPLFRNPILGWLLRFAHTFPIDQERIDRAALRRTHELLDRGEVVALFPEGGTSPTGELQPFFPGLAAIALRVHAPVIPVALTGTNRVVPYGRVFPRWARGGVTVRFGHALDFASLPAGMDRHERLGWATERVRSAIAGLLRDGE